MLLEEACKKAFNGGYNKIKAYNIDGKIVNLDCEVESGDTSSARIIFSGNKYHTDSAYDIDEIDIFANEILKNL